MKKKYILIGDNIVSEYFKNHKDFHVATIQWFVMAENSYDIISGYEAVIYCEEMREGSFGELLRMNHSIPNNINYYLKSKNIPFVYISTADLYNGNYEWEKTKEPLTDLNTSTPYLLSKRAGELSIEENGGLILRIKNPFSEHYHTDNWLVKALKSDVPSNWMDCHTYLPDLERALLVLLAQKKNGIFNVVQNETGSDLYYLQLLNIPKYKDLDVDQDGDVSENRVGADVNSKKVQNYILPQPMNFAIIYSYEKLKDKLDNEA